MDGDYVRAPDGVSNQKLSVTNFANDLGLAPSTYRNGLAQQGNNFRKFREQALVDAALVLLRSAISIDAIAVELGYSDARSFRRFMKSATGRTPSELRHDLGQNVPPLKLRARLKEIMNLIPT